MDPELQQLQQDGLADAIAMWDHVVTVTTSNEGATGAATTVVLHGVQSDVEVDPGDLQQFGFDYKRVFSLMVQDVDIVESLKPGMRAVEANGEVARFLYYKRDQLGTLLFFGSVGT